MLQRRHLIYHLLQVLRHPRHHRRHRLLHQMKAMADFPTLPKVGHRRRSSLALVADSHISHIYTTWWQQIKHRPHTKTILTLHTTNSFTNSAQSIHVWVNFTRPSIIRSSINLFNFQPMNAQERVTCASNVANTTVHPATSPAIDKLTERQRTRKPANAPIVTRRTCPCPHIACTYVPTTKGASVSSAVRDSVDHGFCKVIFARILAKNRSLVHNVLSHSLTSLTLGHIFKHIQPRNHSLVVAVERPLLWKVISTSTRNRLAWEDKNLVGTNRNNDAIFHQSHFKLMQAYRSKTLTVNVCFNSTKRKFWQTNNLRHSYKNNKTLNFSGKIRGQEPKSTAKSTTLQ